MRIAVYALARNEATNVEPWAESCADADLRIVTDTGSTDDTVAKLEAAGVSVARGAVAPWRWDDAHNLSLAHVPADVDVCIRLDLDEVLVPGWREAVEAAWQADTTKLRYWYAWSDQVRFQSDRIHARAGYRWSGATHEGLVRWSGPEVQTWLDSELIRHRRQPGKRHGTDLELLRQAVRENPTDNRMLWYFARELDYAGDREAVEQFNRFLAAPGGQPTERAYARRILARWEPALAKRHLVAAVLESPEEPEALLALAEEAHALGDAASTLHYARQAAACPPASQTHASDPRAYSDAAPDLACRAAWELGLLAEALDHASVAFRRNPSDRRLAGNVAFLARIAQEAGPRAG